MGNAPVYRGSVSFKTPVYDWIAEAGRVRGKPFTPSEVDAMAIIIKHESGGNPRAVNNWDCLTKNVSVLTRRGWLKWDEVEVGDDTIGYNLDTGFSEWTRINQIVEYEDADLITLSNFHWSVTTTPNHRWISFPAVHKPKKIWEGPCHLCSWPEGVKQTGKTRRLGPHLAKKHGIRPEGSFQENSKTPRWVTTENIKTTDRLLLAAEAKTESTLDITVQEAAILGWVSGDGSVEAITNKRRHPRMCIYQCKPAMVLKLKELLTDIPHSIGINEYTTKTGEPIGPTHCFKFKTAYSTDLLKRVGNPKKNAVEQVLAMSAEQRAAWLEAIIDAEGCKNRNLTRISQNLGAVHDAIALAVYLSGFRPGICIYNKNRIGRIKYNPNAWISMRDPIIGGGNLRSTSAGKGGVFCVTTDLGSWTAMQDDCIFLTGNSNARRGTPSFGLGQTIPSTFTSNAFPGRKNKSDPIAQILAMVNYANRRYKGLNNVPGVKSVRAGDRYRPY
jgi:hypothetical protein